MPFFALANWNWGGRLHPLYYNLSIATKALLGLAIMICRLVVLRHSEHEEDQEKGFVGNTILLTQPRPPEIMQKLPPSDDEVSNYLSVCFNNEKMTLVRVLCVCSAAIYTLDGWGVVPKKRVAPL